MSKNQSQKNEELLALREVPKTSFEKTPKDYDRRNRATIMRLITHPSKAVRKATIEDPTIRDMFILAAYGVEEDTKLKTLLEPMFQEASSKKALYLDKVDAQASEIEDLRKTIASLKN